MHKTAKAMSGLVTIATAVWLLAQLVNDRVHLLQYVAWVQGWMILLGIIAPVSLFILIAAGPRAPRTRTVAILTVSTLLLWTLFADFRLHNALVRAEAGPRESEFLFIHWNVTPTRSVAEWRVALDAIPYEDEPDLVIITNPWHTRAWSNLPERAALDHRRQGGRFAAYSAHPLEWLATASLQIAATARTGSTQDPGAAAMIRVHPKNAPPLDILLIDLPADPMLSRKNVIAQTRRRITELRQAAPDQWPRPHVITGDFNIPRGSHALRTLEPGFRNAFNQGGIGRAPTWHTNARLFHIDHTLIAPSIRARRYDTIWLTRSEHAAQRVILSFDSSI